VRFHRHLGQTFTAGGLALFAFRPRDEPVPDTETHDRHRAAERERTARPAAPEAGHLEEEGRDAAEHRRRDRERAETAVDPAGAIDIDEVEGEALMPKGRGYGKKHKKGGTSMGGKKALTPAMKKSMRGGRR
jgi:hypothetical protein